MILTKQCNKCRETKPLTDFRGGRNVCKGCNSKQYRQYARGKGREVVNRANTKFYKKNKDTAQYKYYRYLFGSKSRGIRFEVPFELFEKLYNSPCFYCGATDVIRGLDRVDSAGIYTESNVVPCCKICNFAKGEMSPAEFVAHCRRVISFSEGL